MQTNLLLQGLLHQSLEHCLITKRSAGAEVTSVIVGLFDSTIGRVEYLVRTNTNWETSYFEIRAKLGDGNLHINGERDSNGSWLLNGKGAEKFTRCIDIDISLTPFTNTLPVNRLKLSENESRIIDVLYIDVLEQSISHRQQRYTRQSKEHYKYENVPNDFEAIITVDREGFITDYPGLFIRAAAMNSDY